MTVLNKLLNKLVLACLVLAPLAGVADDDRQRNSRGLDAAAAAELRAAGVDRYAGLFQPFTSFDVGDGWTRHVYDPAGGDGPMCIAGTPYSVYTRVRNPNKVVLFLQGGGACWQGFYNCNILAEAQGPDVLIAGGIWVDSFDTGQRTVRSPIHNWSVVYMPYCDGSVFSGDNAVFDPMFPFGPVRHHRGLRNATAGIDLAKQLFPGAKQVLVAGSSAGGVGAAGFAPFLARFAFGNRARLRVYNDAGPVAINLAETASIAARAADWRFGQFYPASCTACDDMGQGSAIIDWRLDNDRTVREAFYSNDADQTNGFFLNLFDQASYRALILAVHGALHDDHEDRYKRFIRSGDGSHIALQDAQFYLNEADGEPLHRWFRDFLRGDDDSEDIVEDLIPFP